MEHSFSIVQVDMFNYMLFNDMAFFRIHKREKMEFERDLQDELGDVHRALRNDNLFVYAAEVEGKFVAWISIVYIPKVGRTRGKGHMLIDEIWVNPAYRGQKIAKALMAKADALVEQFGALGTRLYVSQDNPDALQLYTACGFAATHGAMFMEKPTAQYNHQLFINNTQNTLPLPSLPLE